jgi:hypothetical protein
LHGTPKPEVQFESWIHDRPPRPRRCEQDQKSSTLAIWDLCLEAAKLIPQQIPPQLGKYIVFAGICQRPLTAIFGGLS